MFSRIFSKTGSFAKANGARALRPKEIAVRLSSGNNGGGDDGRAAREVPPVDEHHDESSDDSYEQDVKSKILQSSLQYVPEHGWSRDTIAAGAHELGYPDTVHGLFPDPGAELALYFYSSSNDSLSRLLKDGTLKCAEETKPELVRFLSVTIKTRLLMLQPYLNQWPQAMALLSKPSNAPRALSNLMTLVDAICYHAGDRSIDTRWYTRRIGLATIYKTSELHLLQDKSLEFDDTWKFVRRAVDECVKLDTMLESNAQLAKDVVTASVSTAKNILGFSWNR
ncbi:ubiquinone biosynthesis protein COQ9, mitochondrial isoform X2 [Sipha flava]|uniref:Ubiquinone biosynthesis protein n=2 Tax=Sipha flava TaxID=143950 RepID=A0A8B8FZ58_9HEMI|nr:ubiquinone biosynthesis protein COQ9, mitochondrial isoform X2 [Sipha flava]